MVAMQSVWHYLIGIRYQHAAVSYAWYGVCFSRYRYHNLHAYVVLAEKFPIYDPITGRIIRANKEITCGKDVVCANPRWSGSPPNFKTVTPVVKDTLLIPVRGYVVIQFVANNPGYWMVHCHIDMHMMAGMAVVFKVGVTGTEFPALPATFPTCKPFLYSAVSALAVRASGAPTALTAACVCLASIIINGSCSRLRRFTLPAVYLC